MGDGEWDVAYLWRSVAHVSPEHLYALHYGVVGLRVVGAGHWGGVAGSQRSFEVYETLEEFIAHGQWR